MSRSCRFALVTVAMLCATGCTTAGRLQVQAIDRPVIEQAQAEIKRQVGVYFVRALEARQRALAGGAVRPERWCGDGNIDYDVASVKVDLLTTTDRTDSVGGGLKIPVFGGSGAPSGSTKRAVSNTQQLTYTLYMLDDRYQPAELRMSGGRAEDRPAPVADVIMAQREALRNVTLKSRHADPQPCFSNFDPDAPRDPQSTLVIGITFSREGANGIKLDLGVVSLDAGTERKASFGNTVTVTFRQRGLTKASRIGPCPDDATKPCVYDPIEGVAAGQPGVGVVDDHKGGAKAPPSRNGSPDRPSDPGKQPPGAPPPAPPVPKPDPVTPPTKMCRTSGSTGILVVVPCPPEVTS